MGIHVKFYHCPAAELARMMRASGQGKEVLDLCKNIPTICKSCNKYLPTITVPRLKIGLSSFFNQNVVTDLFFLRNRNYIILVDDCTRYKVCTGIEFKTAECWLEAVFLTWIRYFGPMRKLTSDQEGAGHKRTHFKML